MMTFREYVQMREGLWLADKNAAPGMSRMNPFPATQARLKPILTKPVRAVKPLARQRKILTALPLAAGNAGSVFAGVPASQRL